MLINKEKKLINNKKDNYLKNYQSAKIIEQHQRKKIFLQVKFKLTLHHNAVKSLSLLIYKQKSLNHNFNIKIQQFINLKFVKFDWINF